MYLNFRAAFGSGSTTCGDVGTIRDSIARTLATVCMCLVSPVANPGRSLAIDGGAQERIVSSPTQSASSQIVTAPATKAVRSSDSRAPGSAIKMKWKGGKLSLDVEGASLSEVLQAVSHETGIEVIGARGLRNHVFRHFADMDLVRALGDLLSGVDYSMTAAGPPGSASTQATRIVITGARVRSEGATSPVKAKKKAPSAPDADAEEDQQAAIELTPGATPDGAREQSSAAVMGEAVTAVLDAAQQESQLAVTEAVATTAANADREEDPPAVIEAAGPTAPDAVQQERRLAAIEAAAANGDLEALRNYLQDVDPAVQAAAFHALAKQAQATAVDDLLAGVEDSGQPTRLQALQLLVQSSEAGDQTVMTALRDALKDPDPAFIAYAAEALAGRDNADAIDALSEAFQSAEPSTKLMIMESVANTQAGRSLLSEALSDSDTAVSSAAAILLK